MHSLYSDHKCDHYITPGEIGRIRKIVEKENIQLDANDAISARVWVQNAQMEGDFAFYKDKRDLPPTGSDLAHDVFILCIQTRFQLQCFRQFGNTFLGIDATHNVTQYKGMLLFTIMACDHWGHGV